MITQTFCREPDTWEQLPLQTPPSGPRPAETASRGTLLSPSWALRSASLSSRHLLIFLQTGGGCFRTAGVFCQRLVGGGISRAVPQQPSSLNSPSCPSKLPALWAALAHSPGSRLRLGEVRRSRFPAGWARPSGSSCRWGCLGWCRGRGTGWGLGGDLSCWVQRLPDSRLGSAPYWLGLAWLPQVRFGGR